MANFTLKRVDIFPSGTSVGAYKQSNWPSNIPPSGAPQGAADATVNSDGTQIAFVGLADNTDYYAVAQVGGVYKYVAFRTEGATSGETTERSIDVGGIGETQPAAGSAAAPAAGAAIASLAAPGAGVYDVEVTSYQRGTFDNADANMELRHGTTVVGKVLSTNVVATQRFRRVSVGAGETISVNATNAGGAGSQYVAALRATRVAQ